MTKLSFPSDQKLEHVKNALDANNMKAHIVENAEQAKELVKKMIPEGSQVMTMTSVTLDETGIAKLINESGKYESARTKLYAEGVDPMQKKIVANLPEYVLGSVHAVTENGQLIIASNTGSQIPAESYSAEKVIFVVGYQKVVRDLEAAMKRINDYVLPLESDRARKAYGVEGSNVSKILIINKEVNPERIQVIIIKEELGF